MLRPLILACAVLMSAGSASAMTFSFDCITGGSSTNCDIGEAQLSLEVSLDPMDASRVRFILRNDGGDDVTAAELYFDDDGGVLASLLSVADGSGVDFEEGGAPPNLPDGNDEAFEVDFLVSAANPAPQNGVNPGEHVTVTFSASLAAVRAALEAGELRVGVHAISFQSGQSKSFLNDPAGVPEPTALALLALGAGWLVLRPRG